MTKLSVSIALCTYNAGPYLLPQLESMARQTRLPEELIVVDDGSKDDTVQVVRDFAATVPFAVKIYVNEQNLGSTKNFERAISLCNQDVIFLSDQDDVWVDHKLERLVGELEANPEVGLVFSDGTAVDKNLQPIGKTLWQAFDMNEAVGRDLYEGNAFPRLMKSNVVTGATLGFRRRFVPDVIPIPTTGLVLHDGWIALIAAAMSRVVAIPEPLILYRQHDTQQTAGVGPVVGDAVMSRRHYEEHIALLRQIVERFDGKTLIGTTQSEVSTYRDKMLHIQLRLNAPANPAVRLLTLSKELLSGRYSRHSAGFRSFVRDVVWPIPPG